MTWNYDMDAAPRDGTRVMLAYMFNHKVGGEHFFAMAVCKWDNGQFVTTWEGEPFEDAVAWRPIDEPDRHLALEARAAA